ncbi:unnamed protein product [Closterium sp. Naga37s-1]|nr:unnamed protein product [Closterium sp. Naga37s-1]
MRIPDSRRTALSPSLCARLVCVALPSRRCLLLGALVLQLLALALLLPRLPPIPRHALSANPLPRTSPPRSVLPRDSLPQNLRGRRAAEREWGGEEAEGLEEDGAWRLYQQWRGDLMGAGAGGVAGREGDREKEGDGGGEKDAEVSRSKEEQQQGGEWERCGRVGDAASMRSAAGMMADDRPRHTMPQQLTPRNTAGGAAGSGGARYLMVEVNGGLNQQRTAVCNAVAVAALLNATLVLPTLLLNRVWNDSSTFGDIFDAPFFIAHLAPFLPVVPTLPPNSFHVPPNYFPAPPLAVRLRRLTRLSLHVAAGLATGRRPLLPPYVLLPPKISPPQWASADYYVAHVGPALRDIGAVRLNPFANRLSSRGLPLSLQRLRCRCNFHSLRFLPPIRTAALTALHRLSAHAAAAAATAARSARSSTGPLAPLAPLAPPLGALPAVLPTRAHSPRASLLPWIPPPARRRGQAAFVAVHVRFEKDMVAFSRCSFSSSPALHRDLQRYRAFAWSRFHHSPATAAWEWLKAALGWGGQAAEGQGGNAGAIGGSKKKGSSGSGEGAEGGGESARSLREAGHCPLTPLEVALFMRAAGISPAMPVFVASGDLYGPKHLMAAFTALFPRTLTKAHLLSPPQLSPFQGHASQLAAIDYLIALHAPLVVLSHGSNFGHVLTGQRRYLHTGHARVLKPDKRRLAQLFTHSHLSWASFRASVHALVRAGREAEHKVERGQVGEDGGDESIEARERVENVTALESHAIHATASSTQREAGSQVTSAQSREATQSHQAEHAEAIEPSGRLERLVRAGGIEGSGRLEEAVQGRWQGVGHGGGRGWVIRGARRSGGAVLSAGDVEQGTFERPARSRSNGGSAQRRMRGRAARQSWRSEQQRQRYRRRLLNLPWSTQGTWDVTARAARGATSSATTTDTATPFPLRSSPSASSSPTSTTAAPAATTALPTPARAPATTPPTPTLLAASSRGESGGSSVGGSAGTPTSAAALTAPAGSGPGDAAAAAAAAAAVYGAGEQGAEGELVGKRLVMVVTPTYPRAYQALYLAHLANTLRAVAPPLLWIVVEGANKTEETARALEHTAAQCLPHGDPACRTLNFLHLAAATREMAKWNKAVAQRNAALQHIEAHRMDGVVYFADDDNVYAPQLFEELRAIRVVGVVPVGFLFSAGYAAVNPGKPARPFVERPLVQRGSDGVARVVGWETFEWSIPKGKRGGAYRSFCSDMAGFAFSSRLLWTRLTSIPGYPRHPVRFQAIWGGYLETTFLSRLLPSPTYLQPIARDATDVWVWHMHAEAEKTFQYPAKAWTLPQPDPQRLVRVAQEGSGWPYIVDGQRYGFEDKKEPWPRFGYRAGLMPPNGTAAPPPVKRTPKDQFSWKD